MRWSACVTALQGGVGMEGGNTYSYALFAAEVVSVWTILCSLLSGVYGCSPGFV